MFLAEISFLLALAVFASGMVLWHRGREASAGPLRAAGAVLVVGAVLTALCTVYFTVRYRVQGDFDHAYASHHPMDACAMMEAGSAHGGAPGGKPGMGPGMMGPGDQATPMRPGEGAPPETTPPGHEEHHPEPGVEN